MAQYRTAQGKVLDMSAFVARNEKVRAVGNMKVNARGDVIDSDGRVVQSVNDKINEYYSDTVTNPGAKSKGVAPGLPELAADTTAPAVPAARQSQPKPQLSELSDVERELEESLELSRDEEILIEQKKQEQQQPTEVAKQTKTKK